MSGTITVGTQEKMMLSSHHRDYGAAISFAGGTARISSVAPDAGPILHPCLLLPHLRGFCIFWLKLAIPRGTLSAATTRAA